ncbi:MAG: hypothetical protein AAGA90_00385 [Actinomycetota bacterium]
MDHHVVDTALKRVLGYAETVRSAQRSCGVSGPFGDAGELGFARQLARSIAVDPANRSAIVQIADHLHLASELMSFHHHRIDWERAHDRVNWGYVSVTIRTMALALREVVPDADTPTPPLDLHLSRTLIEGVAASLSVEAVDRLIAAIGDARRTVSTIDPDHVLHARVQETARAAWPAVSGVSCGV